MTDSERQSTNWRPQDSSKPSKYPHALANKRHSRLYFCLVILSSSEPRTQEIEYTIVTCQMTACKSLQLEFHKPALKIVLRVFFKHIFVSSEQLLMMATIGSRISRGFTSMFYCSAKRLNAVFLFDSLFCLFMKQTVHVFNFFETQD